MVLLQLLSNSYCQFIWHYVTFHITLFTLPTKLVNVQVKEILGIILRNKILKKYVKSVNFS